MWKGEVNSPPQLSRRPLFFGTAPQRKGDSPFRMKSVFMYKRYLLPQAYRPIHLPFFISGTLKIEKTVANTT